VTELSTPLPWPVRAFNRLAAPFAPMRWRLQRQREKEALRPPSAVRRPRSYRAIQTDFSLVYASNEWMPISLPQPLCFRPPKGLEKS
jgi:hypothetical protein